MLYTRKGDKGDSGLFGTSERLPKDDDIYQALGTVDELNSLLGLCRTQCDELPAVEAEQLYEVQEVLFAIQAELAGAEKRPAQSYIDRLEASIDRLETCFDPKRTFVVPGSTKTVAWFDYARAVARRTERCVIHVSKRYVVSQETKAYLNRLSSFLYALARCSAAREEVTEPSPTYQ